MSQAKTNEISISIGDADITFDSVKTEEGSLKASVKQSDKFLFEFDGLLSDKFVVVKFHDHTINRNVVEIYVERGLKDIERKPLVRILHY